MMKAFLLIHSNGVTRDEVTHWADSCHLVETWRAELPNCIFLISQSTATQLVEDFDRRFPADNVRFLVQQFSSRSEGMLSGAGWEFLKDKAHDHSE